VVSELVPDPDQRPVARRDMRVSDDERRAVVDELRVHYGAGRLDLAEFEDRTNAALAARVRGELEPLLDDLPELAPPKPGPPIRERRRSPSSGEGSAALRIHTYVWLVLSAFFIVIYAGTASIADGDIPFWPIFPIAAIGRSVGLHAAIRQGNKGAAGPEA
jgi:Domain of unknown function (DUF1707)